MVQIFDPKASFDHTCQYQQNGCQGTKPPSVLSLHKQNQKSPKKPFRAKFLLPKYWGIWLLLWVFVPLIFLPLKVQFFLGRQLGAIAFILIKKRRQDTLTNLGIAFADKSEQERHRIAKEVFKNQGIGIFETLCAWWRPQVFYKKFRVGGIHHLIKAQQEGRAVLLMGLHTTTLDLAGRIATQFFAVDCVYRPQNNPLLEWIVYNSRRHIFEQQISSRDMKALAASFKAGKVVWYTADQDYGISHGVMAPFFGMPAATITAPRRIVRLGNKKQPTVPFFMSFVRKNGQYHLQLTPIENYPSDNELFDATRLNQISENTIRACPEQWMWFHRRYKTNPNGKNPYQ